MMAVEIHRHEMLSWDCSFINITSIVVLHSSQFGVANLVTRSYKDLQSVTIKAFGSVGRETSGFCHLKEGLPMYPHIHLSQLSLSNDDDMAYASALRVDRTTLPICFELHAMGEKVDGLFSANSGEHAIMNTPCCARSCDADAKLASPKLANVMVFNDNGQINSAVSAVFCASIRTLLASSKVSTVAFVIDF